VSLENSTQIVSAVTAYPNAVQLALQHAEQLEVVRQSHAILLFGSYAVNAQGPGSDVDLFIIGDKRRRIYRDWPEISVDFIIETQKSAWRKLETDNEWNNNFLLNILINAIIIRDHEDVASSLIKEAKRKWQAGPPALSHKEAVRASRALQRMLHSAKADEQRIASLSHEGRVMCRMRLDQVVNRTLYLCFKAKQRWASSFPHSVAWIKKEDPDLYGLWLEYTDAPLDKAQPIVARIVELCLGQLGKCGARGAVSTLQRTM
jgi:predicted nucleotidyltransferase